MATVTGDKSVRSSPHKTAKRTVRTSTTSVGADQNARDSMATCSVAPPPKAPAWPASRTACSASLVARNCAIESADMRTSLIMASRRFVKPAPHSSLSATTTCSSSGPTSRLRAAMSRAARCLR